MNIFNFHRHRVMAPVGEDGGAADRGDVIDAPVVEKDDQATIDAKLAEDVKKLGLAGAKTDDHDLDDDSEDEEEGDDKTKGKKKDSRIPLARHEAILNRERAAREAAETALANSKKGAAVAQTNAEIATLEAKVESLETKYNEALAEGNTKEIQSLMKEIRQTERTIIEQKAEFKTQVAMATTIESMRFDQTIERLYAAYPQLDDKNDSFDQDLVDEVLDLHEAFVMKGMTISAAMQKAVSYVIKPETAKQESAVSTTARVSTAEATAAAKKLVRDTETRKRNAKAAGAQPPALATAGANSDEAGGLLDAVNVIKAPFEDFMKKTIPDDDMARLRGDTV